MMKYLATPPNKPGFALPMVIFVFGFVITVAVIVANTAVASFTTARTDQKILQAQLAADSGIDYAMTEINKDETWTGTTSEQTLINQDGVEATYSLAVTDGSHQDQKFITSTGRTYDANDGDLLSERIYETEIVGSRAGSYSIAAGVGGLSMSNNTIITGGDILVNGFIDMANSTQIGLSFAPVHLRVADQKCPTPPDSTYPRICNSGEDDEPVSINHTAAIYGEVEANNQSDDSGMHDPGLVSSSGVSETALPDYDRTAHKDAVSITRNGEDAACSSGESYKIWEADTKIEGDVHLEKQCEVTLRGDVWITGNLELTQSAKISIASGLTSEPVIMVDGETTRFLNGAAIDTNDSGVGAQIISFYSLADCSPDCSEVNGQDLFDSQGHTAIEMHNSSEAPATLLYSRWARVSVSNSGSIGALAGQAIEMSNKATLSFGGSGVPGVSNVTWRAISYKRIFN